MQNFTNVFMALIFETTPFLLGGVVLSSALGPLLETRLFERLARVRLGGAAGGVLAGLALPVCDCGSRPLAHRLALSGRRDFAVAFLVAAPVVNPIVILTTWLAFRDVRLVLLRMAATSVIALVIALLAGFVDGDIPLPLGDDHDHDHESLAARIAHHFAGLFPYLVVGSALAALIEVKLDQSAFTQAQGLYVSVAAMLALSFLLSVCSSVDAFVVASIAGTGTGPALAFLVFGPIMNLKTLPLYARLFSRAFVTLIAVVSLEMTFVIASVAELRAW